MLIPGSPLLPSCLKEFLSEAQKSFPRSPLCIGSFRNHSIINNYYQINIYEHVKHLPCISLPIHFNFTTTLQGRNHHLEQGLTHGTQQMLRTFLLNNKLTLTICVCVYTYISQFSSVQSLSCAQLFMTPWTAACQASLSNTSSWSLTKLIFMSDGQ